jgi:hypothetical protein
MIVCGESLNQLLVALNPSAQNLYESKQLRKNIQAIQPMCTATLLSFPPDI